MKKMLSILALILPVIAHGQEPSQQSPDPKAMERIQRARIAYLSERLNLTPEQAEKFWPVYRELADKRAALRAQMKESQKKEGLSEQEQKQMVEQNLKVRQQELDLEKQYAQRLLNAITAQQLLDLPKAEMEFRRMVLDQIQQRRIMQQRREEMRDRIDQKLRQRNNQ
jgi:hypothetical protein